MNFLLYILRSLAYCIVDPILLLVLLMLIIVFYLKNKRISLMQKMIIGESFYSPLELTISQIVLGILAGVIGTMLLSYLGVVFNSQAPIEFLFIISIIFMAFKPRYVCFSYSASALAIASIILTNLYKGKTPININLVSIFTFVGVLHIVEGLLVMIDGDKGAVPVFTKKNDKILGGFAFKRYWPIPIAVFLMSTSMAGNSYYGQIPNWWPVISYKSLIALSSLILIPYYGVVGFSSVSFTKRKKIKKLYSGIGILIFGIITVLIAQLANLGLLFEILVSLAVPLLHEFMIYLQRIIEEKGKPVYISDKNGISILEVSPKSLAFKVGIKSGDKIISVNNQEINSELEIYKLAKEGCSNILFKIKKIGGEIIDFEYEPIKNKSMGIILVPKVIKRENAINFEMNKFKNVLNKLKSKEDLTDNKNEKNDDDINSSKK